MAEVTEISPDILTIVIISDTTTRLMTDISGRAIM